MDIGVLRKKDEVFIHLLFHWEAPLYMISYNLLEYGKKWNDSPQDKAPFSLQTDIDLPLFQYVWSKNLIMHYTMQKEKSSLETTWSFCVKSSLLKTETEKIKDVYDQG